MAERADRLVVRATKFDFEAMEPDVTWFRSAVLPSVLLGGATFVFPVFERLMIAELERNPLVGTDLAAVVRGFKGHEARHAAAHERSEVALERMGYRVGGLRRAIHLGEALVGRALLPVARRVSPRFSLALFAAGEHWTAELARVCVDRGARLALGGGRGAPLNDLEVLFLWHALEEIEHRAVVFDIFEAAGGTERDKRAGFVVASTWLAASMVATGAVLGAQTPRLLGRDEWRRRGGWRDRLRRHGRAMRDVAATASRRYWAPGFHPADQAFRFEQSLLQAVLPRARVRVVTRPRPADSASEPA